MLSKRTHTYVCWSILIVDKLKLRRDEWELLTATFSHHCSWALWERVALHSTVVGLSDGHLQGSKGRTAFSTLKLMSSKKLQNFLNKVFLSRVNNITAISSPFWTWQLKTLVCLGTWRIHSFQIFFCGSFGAITQQWLLRLYRALSVVIKLNSLCSLLDFHQIDFTIQNLQESWKNIIIYTKPVWSISEIF